MTEPDLTFFASAANAFSVVASPRLPSITSSTNAARSGDSSARSVSTCVTSFSCFASSAAYFFLLTVPEETFFFSAARAFSLLSTLISPSSTRSVRSAESS